LVVSVLLFVITRRSLILKPNSTSEILDIDTQGPTSVRFSILTHPKRLCLTAFALLQRSHRGSIGQHKPHSGPVPPSEFELDRLRWTVQEEEEGKAEEQGDALRRNESDWSTVESLERAHQQREEPSESQVKLV
jgi:hypothetical protein